MTTQIAVRLPDAVVAYLDDAVAHGRAPSRAAIVAGALERDMRRAAAQRDAEILVARGTADELDALVEWTSASYTLED